MDSAVVSEELSALLSNSEVRAAVFTTYTFDPEFFELEVVPLLLPGNQAFSSDSRVKQFQVREALRQSQIGLDVFYDLPMYRREGSCSPNMEYGIHGVHCGNSAFHAKLALILAYDHNREKECLMVAAGSNNLTRAGWWSSIECVHWEFVWPGECSLRFLNQLKRDIAWLHEQRYLAPGGRSDALDTVDSFLQTCTSSREAADVHYYGLTGVEDTGAFHRFLRRKIKILPHSNYQLEIISPFFASDVDNMEHEFFLKKLGVSGIHILLPEDIEGNALCHPKYFDHINKLPDISWAKWSDESATLLGLRGQVFRSLHAKVYHFYNAKQSWAFVGSVNFTRKAVRDNVEAGFFIKLDRAGPLLKPIKRPGAIDRFAAPAELAPGHVAEDDEALPRIHLAYDWTDQELTGVTDPYHGYSVTILSPEGAPVIEGWHLTGTPGAWEGDTEALERLLRNGSLVKIAGTNTRSGEPFPPHTVMLMQTGWTHKPLDLPDLSAAEILAIYACLTPEQRERILIRPIIRKLVLSGEAGDMTLPEDNVSPDQFFSEYAEIFHAFRQLRQRLDTAAEDGNEPILEYYLTGKGMDSLPTLIEQITSGETQVHPVTAYLVLLCAREIYQAPDYKKRRRVCKLITDISKQINRLKKSESIKLENNTPDRRRVFFEWFEQQFFRVYRTKEVSE